MDGDGRDDILVGAYQYDDGSTYNVGGVYLILAASLGSDASVSLADADYRFVGAEAYDQIGRIGTIAGGGDLNGDGVTDLVCGSRAVETNGLNGGALYVIFGAN